MVQPVCSDRRKFLKTLAVAGSATAVAGCSDDGSDGGEAGERVPPINIAFWTDTGSTTVVFEQSLPGIVDDIEEALGVDVETTPGTLSDVTAGQSNDTRDHHMQYNGYSLAPSRLDPEELTRGRYEIMNAGGNGAWTPPNYASCAFSEPAQAQSFAPTIEERQELVTEAHSVMSEDLANIPIAQRVQYGSAYTDRVDVQRSGDIGLVYTAAPPLIHSVPTDVDEIRTNYQPRALETSIYQTIATPVDRIVWANLVYSPLIGYDENYELENVLAEEYTVSDDGETITFELREGEFHNGDPITAEDVKWTYEFQWEQSEAGNYPEISRPPVESIEVVDDRTVVFELEQPLPFMLTRVFPSWGILPKDAWQEAGAEENPTNFDDPLIGSGPYEVDTFDQGQSLSLVAFDEHATFDTEGRLTVISYDSSEAAFRAFENEELELFLDTPPALANEVREEIEGAEIFLTEGFTNYTIHPYMPYGPQQHHEFREAFSQAIDRSAVNETALYGDSQPAMYSCPLAETHPFYPGEENLTQAADSPQSNPERAREILEDAGWSWDDDGNLLYPDDIDLTPQWPEGEEPADDPDTFPCVSDLEA